MKPQPLTYSIRQGLAKQLSRLAQKLSISPQILLESIIEKYLLEHHTKYNRVEKRAFSRVPVGVPALVYMENEAGSYGRYQAAHLKDIAPGGIGLSCTEGKFCGRVASEYAKGLSFELMFSLPESKHPIWFKCKSKRVQLVENGIHIGAEITEADGASKSQLTALYETSYA